MVPFGNQIGPLRLQFGWSADSKLNKNDSVVSRR
jgi:hypothetical protein